MDVGAMIFWPMSSPQEYEDEYGACCCWVRFTYERSESLPGGHARERTLSNGDGPITGPCSCDGQMSESLSSGKGRVLQRTPSVAIFPLSLPRVAAGASP
jgi:hypothetical protein